MSINKKDFKFEAGSRKRTNEPRLVEQVIIDDILFSNEHPLGIGFRRRKMLEDFFPDTHLNVDLKLISNEPGRMPVGAYYVGVITHDSEEHFTFVKHHSEKKVTTARRNPVVYSGGCVNVHKLPDGTLRLEFNRPRFYPDFSFRDFCLAAAQELLTIARLLGEEDSEV